MSNSNLGYVKKELPSRIGTIGLVLFIVGALFGALGFFTDPIRASFGYLPSFMFLISIGAGSLFLVAVEYLTGADWSVPFRRITEILSGLVPLLIIFALPLLFNIHSLFHWSHPEIVKTDEILQGKSPYLNTSFFIIRVIIIFIIWSAFYFIFIRNSRRQDEVSDQSLTGINIKLSGVFMPVFAITITLSAIDWLMSLEPHWFSTIFGVYFFSGTVLASLAAVTFIAVKLKENNYLHPLVSKDNYYSLGTLLFAFIVFWAYIAFSQYMLIWYADLPEENFWFLHRWSGGWSFLSIILILTHFVVPFGALLSFRSKTNFSRLKFISIWILAAHYIDIYWLVMPNMKNWYFSWVDFTFPLATVGFIIFVFSRASKKINLIPVGDPKLEKGLHFRL